MLIDTLRDYHKVFVERITRLEQIAVAMNRSAIWTEDQAKAERENTEAYIDLTTGNTLA